MMTPEKHKFMEEVGHVGSTHAALALGTLLAVPVGVRTLRAVALPVLDLATLPQPPGDIFVGIHFTLYGENTGKALVMVARDDACRLVDVACRKPLGSTRVLDEYAQSTMREIGNIVTGAYLSAIRSLVQVPLIHSVPYMAMDQWRVIFDSLAASLALEVESVVLIEAELELETLSVRFLLLFIAGQWAL